MASASGYGSAAADRWIWLVLAAHTQLRLARPMVADLRHPWECPAEPAKLTPARGHTAPRKGDVTPVAMITPLHRSEAPRGILRPEGQWRSVAVRLREATSCRHRVPRYLAIMRSDCEARRSRRVGHAKGCRPGG
ncbi:hypothetical protein Acsp05_15650 [Actinokineospora sp. NBRC 105648]|nr:hypothetical protein Acsp05_15650 [Actinokineospora sp. NBRC 105648]